MEQTMLKIIQLNINSLRSIRKRQELELFLKTENPDIVLLNETKLNNSHRVSFRHYKFIRTDRPNNKGGGGTGILVRDLINFTHLSLPILHSIECTAISIQLNNLKKIIVASIYVSKELRNTIYTEDLDSIVNLCDNRSQIIIGGDFNAHHPLWKSDLTSPNGRAIYNWYNDNFSTYSIMLASPFSPSRHCNDTHSFLDFFFISSSLDIVYPIAFNNYLQTVPFESDHDAVILNIALVASIVPQEKITIKNFGNTDWKKFNKKLNELVDNINIPIDRNVSNEEIDVFLSDITLSLQPNHN